MSVQKQLFLTSPINNLSYGLVSKEIIESLNDDVELFISPLGEVNDPSQIVRDGIKRFLESKPDRHTTSLKVYHQFDLAHHLGSGKHIGLPFFELDNFSPLEKTHLRLQDLVVVPSEWAKNIVEDKTSANCVKIPIGVRTDVFHPISNKKTNKCVFLHIGKLEYRKGKDVILRACSRVFNGKDDVSLWMLSGNPFLNANQFQDEVSNFRFELGNKVSFLPRTDDLNLLINKANYGLFPFRAEGWNLPLMECLACGLPVIATNYSAPTEYLNSKNALLLEPDGMEKAYDGIFFNGTVGNWASLDEHAEDRLVDLMEYCYQEWKTGNYRVNVDGVSTANEYSWERFAKSMLEVI